MHIIHSKAFQPIQCPIHYLIYFPENAILVPCFADRRNKVQVWEVPFLLVEHPNEQKKSKDMMAGVTGGIWEVRA
jgi:hypothetical protein